MLLTSPVDLRAALGKVQPRRVAVAYLGSGWRDYLPMESLEEIIVSPTLGTNPWALADLLEHAESHGRPRVYFLEALHAKLYLGDEACLVGSANLSYNGLGGGLLEAGVLMSDDATRKETRRYLDALREQAISDPTTQQKMLSALKERWDRAHWHRTLPNEAGHEATTPTLAQWQTHQGRVHVTWYCTGDFDYNEEVMREAVSEVEREAVENAHVMTFLKEDAIQVGDWLLCWESKKDGSPWKGRPVSWMQVHRLIPDGATKESQGKYTLVALEFPDYEPAPEPFVLTPEVQRLVREQLASGRYPELHGNIDNWSNKAAWPVAQRFLADLKAQFLVRQARSVAS